MATTNTEPSAIVPALYLIPVELGDTPHECILPAANHDIVCAIRHFAVEDVRSARRFLRRVDADLDIDAITFYPMGKHADAAVYAECLKPLEQGLSVGVISEAGCPAVADPGADIVAMAQRRGLRVVPLVGPSSMLLAVMASGLGGQSFAFTGYLPIDAADRDRRIRQLEKRAWDERQTQLFIETPYRNLRMFATLLRTLRPQTRLCIAAAITTADEYIRTLTVAEWRKQPQPDIDKKPAIFLIGR